MKRYADKKKHVSPCSLKVGETVLVKNETNQNKMAPFYNSRPYTVVAKSGSIITAATEDKQITRNSSCFKKAPERIPGKKQSCQSQD